MKLLARGNPDAPLFFSPFPVFFEMWARRSGVSATKFVAEECNAPLPIDNKTLRKMMAAQPTSSLSQKKFFSWAPIAEFLDKTGTSSESFQPMNLGNAGGGAIQWRAALIGIRRTPFADDYGETLDYILALLEEDANNVLLSSKQCDDAFGSSRRQDYSHRPLTPPGIRFRTTAVHVKHSSR